MAVQLAAQEAKGWARLGDRQSLPSLLMVSRELAAVINQDYATETAGREYLDHLTALTRAG
ncbi:hypothetical protein [Streptomyces sp. LN785]|uniref:hypothetical protein n=1 Tax=Streptomyces sp. LN785 TaxID=3112983 RepID=UPI003719DC4C